MIDACKAYQPQDLYVGLKHSFKRRLDEEDVDRFGELSWDRNPLHMDREYAKTTVYRKRVVHGVLQLSLVSAFVGMILPGQRALIGAINANFIKPLFVGQEVEVKGTLHSWNLDSLSGRLKLQIIESSTISVVSDIVVDFTLHALVSGREETLKKVENKAAGAAGKTLLVTGAAGGVGAAIAAELARDHHVTALHHSSPLPDELASLDNVHPLKVDLLDGRFAENLMAGLSGRKLNGIVHAAWPGMPKGGLLDQDPAVLSHQLDFASRITVGLAGALRADIVQRGSGDPVNMVVIGSSAGSHSPNIGVSAYSLGKVLLEQTVRLLAPELARHGISINVIAPTMIPAGINASASDRQLMLEKSRIPMGRTCELEDVCSTVRQFMTGKISFVSGQTITLAGGQL